MTQYYSDEVKDFIFANENMKPSERQAAKHDAGKPDMSLILPEFEMGVAKVLSFGASKYGRLNYQQGIDEHRLLSAVMRHMNSYRAGQKTDEESGLSHLYHVAATLMMLDFYDRKDK